MDSIKTKILGLGIYLPQKTLHNKEIEKIVETTDEWIFERTGIRERRISSKDGGEFPTDMAMKATEDALKEAKIDRNEIDMIIFASVTPDMPIPNSSTILQTKLGITNKCGCFDVAAACSGFVYSLDLADSMIKAKKARNVLVIGSEMLSTIIDWDDRGSCILFGDGCGAAILGQTPAGEDSDILASYLSADGTGKEYFNSPVGGATEPLTINNIARKEHLMHMKGKDMFKVATRTLAQNSRVVLEKAKLGVNDIDWLIPHQANIRIINTTIDLLDFDPKKVVINIEKYGNTSSATIPIAMYEAIKDGRIKRGHNLVFSTFGAGLTSASMLVKY
ncbi:MAG: 3-oxoacyl-ACP synthase [Bdellovibrionales bacterium RIFOXYB1_FULL_37_110]|nr:MAG: 3-oxoacyl-ACP synthase [Bdellovibrionales bacterium RIFOXYA1_FULL_38_20]OFZ52621.1 MAG: 3-oxoacyl-ACP synthase [Bdellovibrionales bacterium RIFOXYC1_FULL_37_79]OFZ59792.1 MAG: 3-oxoacyl-ACP synthase [Bdellovibrionales bacterium RIFOXYB1_FULL_37_110]OFZ62656.1 MAG: 3-oxoacyl-ACP synthase [Bdellovibrionales bacterium RIFOXYD1_FULL_36_51]